MAVTQEAVLAALKNFIDPLIGIFSLKKIILKI